MTPHAVLHVLLTRWGDAVMWHIAVSSVIIGAILLGTSLMRRAPARTRHGLLLLGLVQLVLPGMLLVCGLERAGLDVVGLLKLRHPPAAAAAVTALVPGRPAPLPAPSSGPSEAGCLLLAAWGAGVLILAGLGAVRLVRAGRGAPVAHGSPEPALLAAVAEAAKAAGLGATPRVELADASTPRVVGLLRPRLVLPSGLPGSLEPVALDAVLAHELAHLARRDTLWQVLASALLVASWFNPLAWLAYRRLADEAEAACDEATWPPCAPSARRPSPLPSASRPA
jgi:Zn-dependent protease with chaperone function